MPGLAVVLQALLRRFNPRPALRLGDAPRTKRTDYTRFFPLLPRTHPHQPANRHEQPQPKQKPL